MSPLLSAQKSATKLAYWAATKPEVRSSALGNFENNFTALPVVGKPSIKQKNDNTTIFPERTAFIFPLCMRTFLVKESDIGVTE